MGIEEYSFFFQHIFKCFFEFFHFRPDDKEAIRLRSMLVKIILMIVFRLVEICETERSP